MSKKRVCIDISNIVPGKGGSGGGINTYALNLIKYIDQNYDPAEMDIRCIKHADFTGLENCHKIKFINTNNPNQNIWFRIFWIHIYIPIFCIRNKINLLHRVTPELPLIKVCKYVCTLHDLMFDFHLSNKAIRKFFSTSEITKFKIFKLITRHAIFISDSIIVPSSTIKNEVIEKFNVKSAKITAIYEASENPSRIIEENPPRTYPSKLNIGVIAGFYPHKGHLQVLELANKLIKFGFTDFKIGFRGNPAFLNYIKRIDLLKNELDLEDYIYFVPFETEFKIQNIYSEFDVILLLSEYEGFGLPALEAQANNVPVFCSNIPIFKEILGDSAFFIDKNFEENEIYRLIETFKNKNCLNTYKLLGQSNLKKYSWGKMSVETNNLYKNQLSG